MSECMVFCDDLVVKKTENGEKRLGVVQQVGGVEDSDESSDSDEEDQPMTPLERGFVRVSWYSNFHNPDGEVVPESQLKVVDRSCFPRDVVRIKDGNQLGTVIATDVTSDLSIVGTNKFLKNVDVSKLVRIEAFGPDDIIAFGPWLGRIQETFENLILAFPHGAKAKLCYDTAEDQGLLSEVYPHQMNQDDLEPFEYYPGQLLIGSGKAFKDIKWISGDEIKFNTKTRYKVVVEQVELHGVKVKWGNRAFPVDDKIAGEISREPQKGRETPGQVKDNDGDGTSVDPEPQTSKENLAEPPPSIINGENLKKLKRLDHIWQGHVWVGDRFRFQLGELQAEDLNNQKQKNSKKMKKMKMSRRMEKKLHQSTSQGALDAAKARKRKAKTEKSKAADKDDTPGSDDEGSEYDGDDDEEWLDDEGEDDKDSSLQPSTGSCASIPEEEESEVDVLVNNESDLNITSPVGQIPTMLGMMSCRVGGFELDFTLVQENGPNPKKRFQCNIQNPECPKETTEKISKLFQDFMKSMLKRNKHMLTTTSCATMMSQCPQAVRTFISQQSCVEQHEVFFEYTADGKHTSGIIDNEGKQTEVEYEDNESNLLSIPQAVEMVSKVFNSIPVGGGDVVLTTAPPAQKQAGPNVKFHPGQWITVEISKTQSVVNVQWQDGTIQKNVATPLLLPAHHVDDNDFCPGDFVIDKRVAEQSNYYGVVLKVDGQNRMAKIQWMKDGKPTCVEEVSSYEIADHEQLQFRISDIILRVDNKHQPCSELEGALSEEQAIGELLKITDKGMLDVLWSNGTVGLVHPQDVINVPNDDENSLLDSTDSEGDDDDDDVSWTTASSDEDQGILDSESGDAGDGDQQRPKENGLDLAEANLGMGEGGHPSEHPNHENGAHVDLEENIPIDVVQCMEDITEAVCIVDSELREINDEPSLHHNGKNISDAENEVELPGLDMNDNAPKSSSLLSQKEDAMVKAEQKDTLGDDEGDVTATTSSESLTSNEGIMSNQTGPASFLMESSVPSSHHFANRYFEASKPFIKAVQRDLKLLRTSLPPGITVKTFEDRMDLLSVLIEGPQRTPYENGIFYFDICLSRNYPDSPPSVHYVSYSPRLNPNLYEAGRVCVSLLGTWSGKGSERWTKDSTVLQVLLSIQGLILNSEPYYNEAGYEGHRGTAEGIMNSRCYNEMVILRLVQHMTSLIQNPPKAFEEEVKKFCNEHVLLLIKRVKNLLTESLALEQDQEPSSTIDHPKGSDVGFPLLPLSKGVILSLKTRLKDLESSANSAGYL